jgi:hypothetical protein
MSMNRRIAPTAIVAASSAALMLPTVAPAQAANFDLEAQMRPAAAFPHVRGQAEFDHEGTFHEFEISIHHAGGLAGRIVKVRVHGEQVGSMRVHADGFAHLDRHHGVPHMSAGDVVRVRTKAGKLVSRGVFLVDPD